LSGTIALGRVGPVPGGCDVPNVAPVANPGPAQTISAGRLVTLNGSASSDANNDPLTFSWTLTSKPAGSTTTLSGAMSATPTFTADLAGTYVASLVVNDGKVNSNASTVTITAAPGPTNGNWVGTTGQGRTFSFTVAGNAVSPISFSWTAPGCGVTGTTTTTFAPPLAITANSLNYSSGGGFLRAITGAFSGNQASGTLTFRHETFFPVFCSQTVNTSWTATRQ
jgi:hypothetical protein